MKHSTKVGIAICILVTFILGFGHPKLAWGEEPKLWANSALLMDIKTGQVLYEKEGFKERHPASLTKIMTGILALEYGNLSDVVTISKKTARISVGQTIKLREGQKLTLEDLIYAALMHSANDAAMAIAEHIGGTEEIFLKMMNQKALAIGATKTHFENPNGYTKPNHRTTAYDLALITRYAMSNSTFASIVGTKYKSISKIGEGDTFEVKNTNKLLRTYPGTLGGKTGTTAAAGGCIAAIAKNNDQTLIAVVLKSGNQRRYQDCINLFEYGFNEIKEYKISQKGELWDQLYVPDGKPSSLKIVFGDSLTLKLTKDQAAKIEKRLVLNRKPNLPIAKGEQIGELKVFLNGQEIASIDLIADTKIIKRTFWNSLIP